MPLLAIEHLCCGYGGTDVLRDVSLAVSAGELFCVAGPNGCGKSTLLKAASRAIDYRGAIAIDGVDIRGFSRKALARKIALLGQFVPDSFPYTVYETVSMGRYAHAAGFLNTLSPDDKRRTRESLEEQNLWEERDRLVTELSGGQLQRVFLARTLAQDPNIILLDEPTNHLDMKHQVALFASLAQWASGGNIAGGGTAGGRAVIAVIHDLNLALHFASRAAVMAEGRIIATGSPGEAFSGETLKAVWGMDIRAFMRASLEKWGR
ncbi:MAG: ferric enterobactin transport ATP-binding protein/iron complex transport system ATP-binding protein [Treponematales bacterium]